MKDTDHAKLKLFFFVERQSPVMNHLSSRAKEDIQKVTICSEVRAKFIRNGENNVTMSAIDELFFNRSGAVVLISGAAGIAEAGMTTKRNETDTLTARTFVKSKSLFRVTTRENSFDLINDNRSDIRVFFKEGIPMIF